MDNKNLKKLFEIILKRIKKKKASLGPLKNHKNVGIEAWLKVEAVKAIADNPDYKIISINKKINKEKIDLHIIYKNKPINIELKGMSTFNYSRIYEGIKKYKSVHCCLFLVHTKEENYYYFKKNYKDVREIIKEWLVIDSEYWLLAMIQRI